MDLKHIGEFGLIARIKAGEALPDGVTGIGDDCAVLPQADGRSTLVSTDMLMEGTHFLLPDAKPYDLGWKSAAVNLSDIAAMGGRPVGTFLAFALPQGLDSEWTDEFLRGYREISALCGAPLLGGDTTSSPDRLCICVTVLGECPSGRELRRDGARIGDLVCVTGPLGDSAAGLELIKCGDKDLGDDELALVDRHYRPMPRVAEGLALASSDGVHAMMDISDGIGSDLGHILDASGVGAEIDVKAIPISDELRRTAASRGWDAHALATDGGEDYELLFTVAPEAEKSLTVPHSVIGRITKGSEAVWSDGSVHEGFKHF